MAVCLDPERDGCLQASIVEEYWSTPFSRMLSDRFQCRGRGTSEACDESEATLRVFAEKGHYGFIPCPTGEERGRLILSVPSSSRSWIPLSSATRSFCCSWAGHSHFGPAELKRIAIRESGKEEKVEEMERSQQRKKRQYSSLVESDAELSRRAQESLVLSGNPQDDAEHEDLEEANHHTLSNDRRSDKRSRISQASQPSERGMESTPALQLSPTISSLLSLICQQEEAASGHRATPFQPDTLSALCSLEEEIAVRALYRYASESSRRSFIGNQDQVLTGIIRRFKSHLHQIEEIHRQGASYVPSDEQKVWTENDRTIKSLPPSIQIRLHYLYLGNWLCADEIDERCLVLLRVFPEPVQHLIIDDVEATDLQSCTNRSGFFLNLIKTYRAKSIQMEERRRHQHQQFYSTPSPMAEEEAVMVH